MRYIFIYDSLTLSLSSFLVSAKRDICAVWLHNGQMHWEHNDWNSRIWMPPTGRNLLCQWKETSSYRRWIRMLQVLHMPMWVPWQAFLRRNSWLYSFPASPMLDKKNTFSVCCCRWMWRLGRPTLHYVWWRLLQLSRKLHICLNGRDHTKA